MSQCFAVLNGLRAISKSGTPVEGQSKDGTVGVGKEHLF